VASGNNNSNRNSTLPLPELNPLLNPVLGAHMGRWAEVYFTSPPEKREEAVLDLLRELQGGEGATLQPPNAADSVAKQPPAEPSPPTPAAEETSWEIDFVECARRRWHREMSRRRPLRRKLIQKKLREKPKEKQCGEDLPNAARRKLVTTGLISMKLIR
jgi:hypothetical protein